MHSKLVPFDITEITDVLAGVRYEEDFGSFMRSRDVRRKAYPEELDDRIYDEPEQSTSFNNLQTINLDA